MVDPLGLSTWETIKFHSRMIPRFIRDEGMDVISRSATVIGGGGQVALGGALCKTVMGCIAGAPIAGLGVSTKTACLIIISSWEYAFQERADAKY